MNPSKAGILSIACSAMITASSFGAPFTYDFETLTVGQPIVGQDGWTLTSPSELSPFIELGSGANTTITLSGVTDAVGNQVQRSFSTPLDYTAADTAIEWRVDARATETSFGTAHAGAVFSLTPAPNSTGFVGIGWQYGRALITNALGTNSQGAILNSDWYQYRMLINFSVNGGSGSLSYRDLTTGQSSFTPDPALQNINLGLTPNGQGHYLAGFAQAEVEQAGSNVDNLFIVPEPSTAILGAVGLASLLLRRKRCDRNSRNA